VYERLETAKSFEKVLNKTAFIHEKCFVCDFIKTLAPFRRSAAVAASKSLNLSSIYTYVGIVYIIC
jgi:hypothetical protein